MITLDYRTLNPRWGYSGLYFNSWESYSFTLGYLSNPAHHRHLSTIGQGIISIHVEPNHEQDAWAYEGRIHYYGTLQSLAQHFQDLNACSSAGNNGLTRRINSNGYITSLVQDYHFIPLGASVHNVQRLVPPTPVDSIMAILYNHLLSSVQLSSDEASNCMAAFQCGYNLIIS